MLSKGETLRKGGGGIAPNWPCWDTKNPIARNRGYRWDSLAVSRNAGPLRVQVMMGGERKGVGVKANWHSTENKMPIFGPDFPLDFGVRFSRLPVHFRVITPSAQKLQNIVMESFVMESFGLIYELHDNFQGALNWHQIMVTILCRLSPFSEGRSALFQYLKTPFSCGKTYDFCRISSMNPLLYPTWIHEIGGKMPVFFDKIRAGEFTLNLVLGLHRRLRLASAKEMQAKKRPLSLWSARLFWSRASKCSLVRHHFCRAKASMSLWDDRQHWGC